MELSEAASQIFERRKAHYTQCCALIASNRQEVPFSDLSIQDLVFLGHHTATTNIKKVLEAPRLSEVIQAHIRETKYDVFKGWHMYCNVQSDDRLKALAIFEGAISFAAASIVGRQEREAWVSSCMELLDSLRHHTRDVHKQGGGKRSAQNPNNDNARSSQGVQEISKGPTAGPSDDLPSRPQKRRRANIDSRATGSAVAAPNLPLVARLTQPSSSSNVLSQASTSGQNFSNSSHQIATLRHGPALESHLGDFLWKNLCSRQEPTTDQVACAAFLHIPMNSHFDFMLELSVTTDAGKSAQEALNSSFDTLEDVLGRIVFEGAGNSKKVSRWDAPPWWQGPQTYIEETAEEAGKKHLDLLRQEKAAIHIYTDGSGTNGQIGAAAVCPTIKQTRGSFMGTENVSTVYAGELQGISLALDIAQQDRVEGYRRSKVIIYTDNQAAIRSSAKPKGKSGAYLLKKIVAQTTTLQEQSLPIEIRWVPAHTGVQGNEDADRAAKEATGWRER
ncbi:hypothetical protein Purlil1_13485 [Purpureocillium lilacinum]|uniref:RNase H type-1 domain-containing protein n=1 Tax=Purpureocillium lilacinum TaxID=33203 RepID=A0ABR0BDZ9_PURLI|nr:hypothetical protein Purlil1_13485 [Purpureocillium lilacinum]